MKRLLLHVNPMLAPRTAVWVLCLLLGLASLSMGQALPIGIWHFDETSGSTAADSSSNARIINLSGGYTHTTGAFDEAITFNGTTGYGTTSSWGQLTGGASRSVSLWFKTTSTTNGDFVCWGGTGDGTLSRIGIWASNGPHIGFFGDPELTTSNSCALPVSTSNYCDGKWHHLAFTYNPGLVTAELYLDGVLVKSADVALNTGSSKLFVGRSVNGGEFFKGSLDELAIYNYTISATQVATLAGFGTGYPYKMVSVLSPAYCADVGGSTTISFVAPGFVSATAKCWQSGPTWGNDTTIATMTLTGTNGAGSFVFPAASYPHGPIAIRITGTDGKAVGDTCFLQLYNTGGVSWNEGVPSTPPSAASAAGLSLVYQDDFTSMPSMSPVGAGYTYGSSRFSLDNSTIPFTDVSSPNNPFLQRDTYLRIRCSSNQMSAGYLCSRHWDGSGFMVPQPCYMECRFIAPSAEGTWPAFWTCTTSDTNGYVDEEDIIEGYGGDGGGQPTNGTLNYNASSHEWGQTGIPSNEHIADLVNMAATGGSSGWAYTAHVYGMLVTGSTTTFYLDNIQIGSKVTSPMSVTNPFYFMVNLAAGGGWPVDLSRYGGIADMYVDYVRVYAAPPTYIAYNGDANGDVTTTGSWTKSFGLPGYYGGNGYLYDGAGDGGTVQFSPNLEPAGTYEVSDWWVSAPNRATNALLDIVCDSGTIPLLENQQINGGRWVPLGAYPFEEGNNGGLIVSDSNANGLVVANAVSFTLETANVTADVVVDNSDFSGVTTSGTWSASVSSPGYWGMNYLFAGTSGTASVAYTPNLPVTGNYQVYATWPPAGNRASNASFSIVTSSGSVATVTENELSSTNQWNLLGTYNLSPTNARVTTSNKGANGLVIADAVRFVLASDIPLTSTISASAVPAACGSVTGGGSYTSGEVATVLASPNPGFVFANWTQDGLQVSNSASYSFKASGNSNLVANFQSTFASWQAAWFTSQQLGNSSISGPTAQPAGDGISNVLKYGFNANPLVSGRSLLPVASTVNGLLSLTYTCNTAAADLTYIVEVSSDLQTWNSGTGSTTAPVILSSSGTTETVQVSDLTPASSSARQFIRLRVIMQ
jgi:hypothetical protein